MADGSDSLPIGENSESRALRRTALLLTLALFSLPVEAHKLQLFASVEGDWIKGMAYFAGGARARGARILVQDHAGQSLAELTTRDDGGFGYRAQHKTDHLIIAETPDGHRAEWRVAASELTSGGAAHLLGTTMAAPVSAKAAATLEAATLVKLDPNSLAAIEQAVARQVRPLREELIASQERARLQDVLGGIGYIFGLAGFAFWWRGQRARGRS